MQKILSWILCLCLPGWHLRFFICRLDHCSDFVFRGFGRFLWIRYKQRKAVKLMFERNASRERQHPRGEIIDAEYEIIDDNKH